MGGDRQYFSSGHPTMQAVNPRVYKILLGALPKVVSWSLTDEAFGNPQL